MFYFSYTIPSTIYSEVPGIVSAGMETDFIFCFPFSFLIAFKGLALSPLYLRAAQVF